MKGSETPVVGRGEVEVGTRAEESRGALGRGDAHTWGTESRLNPCMVCQIR